MDEYRTVREGVRIGFYGAITGSLSFTMRNPLAEILGAHRKPVGEPSGLFVWGSWTGSGKWGQATVF